MFSAKLQNSKSFFKITNFKIVFQIQNCFSNKLFKFDLECYGNTEETSRDFCKTAELSNAY